MPSDEDHADTAIGQGLSPSIIDRLLSGDARTAAALAAGGENQWVELKVKLPAASMIIKVLAAFANSGGGVLIVGVDDTGQATGWQRADSDGAARQMREIADSALPDLTHVRVGQADDSWLAWIVVESAHEPFITADDAYWRRASSQIIRSSRVFVNNVPEDDSFAELISDVLARAGVPTVGRPEERTGSWSWDRQALADLVRANDVVLQLRSNSASRQYPDEGELQIDLQKRGATLIPVVFGREVLVEADRRAAVIVDTPSTDAVSGLVEVVTATSWIDFSVLTPYVFEKLVADLLTMLGFRIDGSVPGVISGLDFKATYVRSDPFGASETETWLVDAKLYQHSRVRLETIREIIGAISLEPAGARGLLVTNSQISSVVRDYLAKIEGRSQARLRIMDGVELKRLIARFPQLVDKYFRDPESASRVR